ncbi:MAG: hypothetical protein GWN58_27700 [Anaerolineae bacterium]|nr:hypothetical protein [Anaerolineae bacterium]
MTNYVTWIDHLTASGAMDVTVEDTFRCLSEYAGIHDFVFDDELNESALDLDDFTITSGTWSELDDIGKTYGFITDGPGSSQWGIILSDNNLLPKSFVLNLEVHGDYGMVIFHATDANNLCYVNWTPTQVDIGIREASVWKSQCLLPKVIGSVIYDLTISVQGQTATDDCFIAVWAEGQFLANAHLDTYPTGRKLGFATYDTETSVSFRWPRIPELTEVLDVVTMDAGETPGSALSRAIGRRHINRFVRFDGSLRVWRPKARSADLLLYESDLERFSETLDYRQLVSHWRQVGAWDTADAWDYTLLEQVGHRFVKDDNPNLMTVADCTNEATYALTRAQEYAHGVGIVAPCCPVLEPEDRVAIDGYTDDWLVTSQNITLQAGALKATISGREYTYG